MSQINIPDQNLAIYLQKYSIEIKNAVGNIVGSRKYSTVAVLPSDESGKRVWQLNLSGVLDPNIDVYSVVYDFSNVNYKYKDQITFENEIAGTFNICGRVLDASKIIKYEYSDEKSTLTIEIDTKNWDFRLKKRTNFNYQLNVDDDSSTCGYSTTCPKCGDAPTSTDCLVTSSTYDACPFVPGQIPIENVSFLVSLSGEPNNYYVFLSLGDSNITEVQMETSGECGSVTIKTLDEETNEFASSTPVLSEGKTTYFAKVTDVTCYGQEDPSTEFLFRGTKNISSTTELPTYTIEGIGILPKWNDCAYSNLATTSSGDYTVRWSGTDLPLPVLVWFFYDDSTNPILAVAVNSTNLVVWAPTDSPPSQGTTPLNPKLPRPIVGTISKTYELNEKDYQLEYKSLDQNNVIVSLKPKN